MIRILKKKNCCGCGACVQKCPKSCIKFQIDEEGFFYPQVDERLCVNCGLCEKVCPILSPLSINTPISTYALKNTKERIRMESSSGGVFSLMAEDIINDGGVVFGAKFDEKWQVVIGFTETIKGIVDFRGSKYVQSRIDNSYKDCEKFLKQGRKVLFSGTPCQIAGLRNFLKKSYPLLYTVDIICHGVPSPKVWWLYLNEILKDEATKNDSSISIESIKKIEFRNKQEGWRKYHFVLTFEEICGRDKKQVSLSSVYQDDLYMKAFLQNLILRPSCYECKFRDGRCHSDISLADFWAANAVMPQFDDDKGVSAVLVNSQKGQQLLNLNLCDVRPTALRHCKSGNGGFKAKTTQHPRRDKFFKQLDNSESVIKLIEAILIPTPYEVVRTRLMSLTNRIIAFIKKKIKKIIK